jgi:hypothetical protein
VDVATPKMKPLPLSSNHDSITKLACYGLLSAVKTPRSWNTRAGACARARAPTYPYANRVVRSTRKHEPGARYIFTFLAPRLARRSLHGAHKNRLHEAHTKANGLPLQTRHDLRKCISGPRIHAALLAVLPSTECYISSALLLRRACRILRHPAGSYMHGVCSPRHCDLHWIRYVPVLDI